MSPFFRKRAKSTFQDVPAPPPAYHPSAPDEHYFGQLRPSQDIGNAAAQDSLAASSLRGNGQKVLLDFIKHHLGRKAHSFVVRLLNKNPIKHGNTYSYSIHQSTEDSDLQIVLRDLTGGRLYRQGTKYLSNPWTVLLFGDKFAPSTNRKQVHELTYIRSACTCLVCLVHAEKDKESNSQQQEHVSNSSSNSYTPKDSALANFVRPFVLPKANYLKLIGGVPTWKELEIGTVVRLNSRAGAKLKFTEDMRTLFGHLSYTGPMTHELMYRTVTTIGVNYYLYNKGKKERKVYLQGDLYQLPLEMGVVKLGTRPLRTNEVGAYHILYRRQVMKIYVGELVLEGNNIGSHIPTGIKFFLGLGEEDGCAPIYPDHRMGPPRRLGVNELLLHHHMVDDLKVRVV